MSDPARLPGARDVRTTLDSDDNSSVVVACPPHPRMGGDRHDSRLRAVSDALLERDIDCLRIDYGAFDEGRGERTDALTALAWAHGEYDHVGLFGYSFGGAVALAAVLDAEDRPAAVSALAPAADSVTGFDPATLAKISIPAQIVYGERDDTAAWQSVVEHAREGDFRVDSLPADHFFVSQQAKAADLVGSFFRETLGR